MSTVEDVKAAAAKLNPDEQVELFRWWVESDAFRQRQLAALKHNIATGVEQLDGGKYHACDDSNLMQLAEETSRAGRERLAGERKNPEA